MLVSRGPNGAASTYLIDPPAPKAEPSHPPSKRLPHQHSHHHHHPHHGHLRLQHHPVYQTRDPGASTNYATMPRKPAVAVGPHGTRVMLDLRMTLGDKLTFSH